VTGATKRLSLFWLLLVLVTVMSFESSLFGTRGSQVIVIVIALFKSWIVGREFMELRGAVLPLRAIFATWHVLVGAALLSTLYFFTG
jgi:hypothetical protein